MTAAIIAIIGLSLTFIAFVVTITRYVTKVETLVNEIRKERNMVKTIPVLTYRMGFVENHLGLKTPPMPQFDHSSGE